MIIVLNAAEIDRLLAMGYFRDRRTPRKAVLIMTRGHEKGQPIIIDEYGYRTPITFEQAAEL